MFRYYPKLMPCLNSAAGQMATAASIPQNFVYRNDNGKKLIFWVSFSLLSYLKVKRKQEVSNLSPALVMVVEIYQRANSRKIFRFIRRLVPQQRLPLLIRVSAKRVLKDTTSGSPTGIPLSTRTIVSSMSVMRKTKTQSRRGSLSDMYSETRPLDTPTSDRNKGFRC